MLHYDESRKAKLRRSRSAPQLTSTSVPITKGIVQRAQSSQILPQDVPSLQRTMGNHRIQRMITPSSRPSTIQRKDDEKLEGVDATSPDDMPELEDVPSLESGESSENILEDVPELEQGESSGFTLINEEKPTADTATKTTPKGHPNSRYYKPGEVQGQADAPKKGKTAGQKVKEFGKSLKRFGLNNTVGFYGEDGVWSFLLRDEAHIAKAEKYYAKGIKHPNEEEGKQYLVSAIQQLRGISGATKIESKDWAKRVPVALLAPVWTIKQRILHARWKAIMRKLGVKSRKQINRERMEKQEKEKENQKAAEPQHEWWRARPEVKDWFGKFGSDMDLDEVGYHGRDKSLRQRLLERKKWRMRELSDQGIIAGGHKLSWMPHYTDTDQERNSTSGVKLGQHRWHMQVPSSGRRRSSDLRIGIHRPDWGFEKPKWKPKTGIEMGKHRPIWGFNKPTGERSSSMEMGTHRPIWGFDNPTQERSSSLKLGKQREWQGFNQPSGRRTGFKNGFKFGKQRRDWSYTPDEERTSSFEVGSHRPVWGFDKPGGEQSGMTMGSHRPIWGFDKPGGEQSGVTMGSHRPVWGFDKPNGDKSRFKLSRHRKWDFDKPQGPRGPISTSQHRIPWEEGHQRFIRVPGDSPQISSHRNLLSPNEVPEMHNPSQSNLSNTGTTSQVSNQSNAPMSLSFGKSQNVSSPQHDVNNEELNEVVPIEQDKDYRVISPIKNVKQGRKGKITLDAKRWFFVVKIYTEGKKPMVEIELDDMSGATVPLAALEGKVTRA